MVPRGHMLSHVPHLLYISTKIWVLLLVLNYTQNNYIRRAISSGNMEELNIIWQPQTKDSIDIEAKLNKKTSFFELPPKCWWSRAKFCYGLYLYGLAAATVNIYFYQVVQNTNTNSFSCSYLLY